MSKSMYIIDTPAKCGECPLCYYIPALNWKRVCVGTKYEDNTVSYERVPLWCPLKNLPETSLIYEQNVRYIKELYEWINKYYIEKCADKDLPVAVYDVILEMKTRIFNVYKQLLSGE